ncbi:hypothetical protein SNOG_09894 [Parastagonospora nodorum SN15]|uniref:Calcineurin-like phosphoesterase domain-containing protein n=1 Tax=Phaeosphaeria nodorum (strain SN15 / ATCC MYA-4574 / FGSC 10173) TaxID=321614 RepID=Q0UEC0_PHANO|nr:hypothetical protein SNOG_09894 [Parastagonospora nodorum SN15]EAT83159.1 hypothetical protein SNOG_09894 [Parastagonospora nodorum SN15]
MTMDPLLATADAAVQVEPASLAAPRSTPPPVVPGRLWAISDTHLSFKANREALEKLLPHPNDDLILCGDVGESLEHCRIAFAKAKECFRRVWWVPGNHELYTMPAQKEAGARGEAKYLECVQVARQYGVLTPEDAFVLWEGEGGPVLIAPIFTLYDYSFRPDHVKLEDALAWAREKDIEATDEHLLHPDPYSSSRVPRFSLWCGTKKTEDWHTRFNAKIIISGHLHVRRTDFIDDTRFEEVSLGYPRQWQQCQDRGLDINDMLRNILPGPETPPDEQKGTIWRQFG